MSDDLGGIDHLFADPNGPAYQRTETRHGPPLDYVAEKLRGSLHDLHRLHSQAMERAATVLPEPVLDEIRGTIAAAFYHACVAYLALQNMLAHAGAASFAERLLAMPDEDFQSWLDDIDQGGSVT